jgi:hypothetical protein
MTRVSSVVALAIVTVSLGMSLGAQSHPDWTGDWVLNRDMTAGLTDAKTGARASATGGGAVARGGAMMSDAAAVTPEYRITVAADTVTIDRVGAPTPQKYLYKLDGSESINTVGTTTTRTKSHWAGASLITEGTREISTSQGKITATMKETRSLDNNGAMVVEMTRQVEGQAASTTYQVFVKKPKT